MRTMNRKPRLMATLLVLALLAFGGFTMGVDPVQTVEATPAAEVATITGQGFWEKLACVGCIAAFSAAGGGTIVGVALVAAVNVELAAACVGTCVIAFS